MISVDTKKKDLVGDFKNQGRSWRPAGDPVPVHVHDFADPLLGKAIPYGVYDLAATRTGLHVTARLDTNTYPTGAAVRDAETAALPLTRRAFHGDWNYALHPQPALVIPAARTTQTHKPEWEPALLSDPSLTGMSRRQLDDLVQNLAQHGDSRRGRPPRLAFPDQVLATVLHLRVNLAAEPLAVLFGSSRTAMHRTLLETRRLLVKKSPWEGLAVTRGPAAGGGAGLDCGPGAGHDCDTGP